MLSQFTEDIRARTRHELLLTSREHSVENDTDTPDINRFGAIGFIRIKLPAKGKSDS